MLLDDEKHNAIGSAPTERRPRDTCEIAIRSAFDQRPVDGVGTMDHESGRSI